MRLTRSGLTTIGRALDLQYSSNRAIAAGAPLAAMGGMAIALALGRPAGPSILHGLALGGATFVGWAVGREVDPDFPGSAVLAAVLSLTTTALLGAPAFALLLWALIGLRMLNRSTGLPAGVLDTGGFVMLSLVSAFRWGTAVAALAAAVIFADGMMAPTHPGGRRVTAAMLGAALAVLLIDHVDQPLALPAAPILASVLACGLWLSWTSFRTSRVTSVDDRHGRPLRLGRVRAAQLFAYLAAALVACSVPGEGFRATAPLWASVGALVARGLLRRTPS